MSNSEVFEQALEEVFEGRQILLSPKAKDLVQKFYERAQQDKGAQPQAAKNTSRTHGTHNRVLQLGDLKSGDVITNSYLSNKGVGRLLKRERRGQWVTEFVDLKTRQPTSKHRGPATFSQRSFTDHGPYFFC